MADPKGVPEGDGSGLKGTGKYAGLGLQFALSIIVFLKIGEWVDRRFGTEPIFLTVGVFTGAGAAFYSMYRGLMADQRKAEQEKEDQKKRDRQGPGAGMGQS
jgi:Uncharacterized protein conserved in bacteria